MKKGERGRQKVGSKEENGDIYKMKGERKKNSMRTLTGKEAHAKHNPYDTSSSLGTPEALS